MKNVVNEKINKGRGHDCDVTNIYPALIYDLTHVKLHLNAWAIPAPTVAYYALLSLYTAHSVEVDVLLSNW